VRYSPRHGCKNAVDVNSRLFARSTAQPSRRLRPAWLVRNDSEFATIGIPMAQKVVFLMYHELEQSGTPLCRMEPGYRRYVVSAPEFEAQMRWLKTAGIRATDVTKALAFPEQPTVALTFDDGCASDLLIAAPVLHDLGFRATFYITVGWLDSVGFLSSSQVRELSDFGFDIGCHSMTHPHLSEVAEDSLRHEMLDSKHKLEDLVGRPVMHFSCPGGRYNRRVQAAARQFGYRTVSTSYPCSNSPCSDPYELGRVVIMRNATLHTFQTICRNERLWRLQAVETVRGAAKRILGNTSYDHLRAVLLGGQSDHEGTSH